MNSKEPKPKRRWARFLVPRYSLRTLLILVTVIAVVLGYHVHKVQKQKEAVAWVLEQGGGVSYAYLYIDEATFVREERYGWEPEFVRNLLGDDFFYDVKGVGLSKKKVSDLAPLVSFTNLKWLLLDGTKVSDLSPVASLTNLEYLDLTYMPVSDLSPLVSLSNLELLRLGGTKVSDLSPLASLTSLQELRLDGTKVSDLSPLASLINLEELWLDGTKVSDLSPLASLKNLEFLEVVNSKVTKEEIEKLQIELPQCIIFHHFVQ